MLHTGLSRHATCILCILHFQQSLGGRKRSDWRMYNGIFSGWVDHVIGLLLGLSSWEDDNVAWLTPATGWLDPLWWAVGHYFHFSFFFFGEPSSRLLVSIDKD